MGNEEKMTRFMQIRKIVVREFIEVKTINQLAKGKNLWFHRENGFVKRLIIGADNDFIKFNVGIQVNFKAM